MPETLWAAIEAVLAAYFTACFCVGRVTTHHWSRCGGGIVCFVVGQDCSASCYTRSVALYGFEGALPSTVEVMPEASSVSRLGNRDRVFSFQLVLSFGWTGMAFVLG